MAILGVNLPQLICGHRILDKYPNSEIYLISERAEAGLIGESPGYFQNHFQNLYLLIGLVQWVLKLLNPTALQLDTLG